MLFTALAMCGIVSAYAVCYSNVEQYCQTVGSLVNYHTYMPGEDCYTCCSQQYPSITVVWSDQGSRCATYRGSPDVPYNRAFLANGCRYGVSWTDCNQITHPATWLSGYYYCTDQCTP